MYNNYCTHTFFKIPFCCLIKIVQGVLGQHKSGVITGGRRNLMDEWKRDVNKELGGQKRQSCTIRQHPAGKKILF